jgi:hypothetical protein
MSMNVRYKSVQQNYGKQQNQVAFGLTLRQLRQLVRRSNGDLFIRLQSSNEGFLASLRSPSLPAAEGLQESTIAVKNINGLLHATGWGKTKKDAIKALATNMPDYGRVVECRWSGTLANARISTVEHQPTRQYGTPPNTILLSGPKGKGKIQWLLHALGLRK